MELLLMQTTYCGLETLVLTASCQRFVFNVTELASMYCYEELKCCALKLLSILMHSVRQFCRW